MLTLFALVDSKLEPIAGAVLCSEHFTAEYAKRVADATEGYLGWRPITGDYTCVVCHH